MSFAADRALQALKGILATPTAAQRSDVGLRLVDATFAPPPVIVIPRIQKNADPLEDFETRRNILQTIIPPGGATAVISVAVPRRDLEDPYQGGGPGPFGGGRRSAGFILHNVKEELNEKHQIYQTFNGYILYSMGKAPSIYTFSGYLPNTGGSGSKQFLSFYSGYMRASAAVSAGAPSSVSYLSSSASGYVLSVRVGHDASTPGASTFSFSMLLAS